MGVLLLVRHGQASFGSDDYDVLSQVGHEQSRLLGRSLAARGIVPDRVIRGAMRRHQETVAGILEGLGGSVDVELDRGWDEFDFAQVIDVHQGAAPHLRAEDVAAMPETERRAGFQALFEEATRRWVGGEADHEYAESFPTFTERVASALRRSAEPGPETVLVVTSGGPIALCAAQLLGGDASLWGTLNRVAVNTAVTKVIRGRSGLTLSTYNAHEHLEHDRSLVTYR